MLLVSAVTAPGQSERILMESPESAAEGGSVQTGVPKEILEPILKEAATIAKVSREQLAVVRAEPAVWNDGSLGCSQPGLMYTQALVNGYWVLIKARGQMYDFRADNRGSFILCPPGQGRPPSQPGAVER
jgi:hypothetical protein